MSNLIKLSELSSLEEVDSLVNQLIGENIELEEEFQTPSNGFGLAVLARAQADLGVKEDLGKNDGNRIREYFKLFNTSSGQDWCAAALSTWMREAGGGPVPGGLGAKDIGSQFRQSGLWVNKKDLQPWHLVPGNIVVWHRGSPDSWKGHIGVIESFDGKNTIITIEANSGPKSDQVARMTRRVDDSNLIGIGLLSGKNKLSLNEEDLMIKELNKYAADRKFLLEKFAAQIDMNISLNEKEKNIFDLLMQVVKDKAPELTLRAAGGWVRDKLLGKESHDIDIAVDKISGFAFGKLVLEWMQEKGLPTPKDVTKIDANTEANKNIESATLPIFGIGVDFVQLRKDTYNEDSRNPEVQVGVSAKEDAERRDLTINAIFYNLNTNEIEDYVGGVADLEKGIARTPIDPIKTYLEDPLRLIRSVRFSAKYNLELDPSIIEAAKHPKIREAFQKKITRERIWKELVGEKEVSLQNGEEVVSWKRGLMIGPNFDRAAKLLGELGLRDLFLTPTKEQLERAVNKQEKLQPKNPGEEAKPRKWQQGFTTWELNQNNPHHDLDVWNHTLAALKYLHQIHQSNLTAGVKKAEEDEIVRNLAMLFHDIGKCDLCSRQEDPRGYSTYHEHELSSAVIAEEILTDIKAPTNIKDRIVLLVKNHMRLHTLPENVTGAGLRRIVRDVGKDWSNLVEMSKSDAMGKTMATSLPEKYDNFAKIIDQFLTRTQGKSEIPPPINGHEIMATLNLNSRVDGKKMGIVTKALKEALLENPDMTKDECIEFIKTINLETNT